MSNAIRIHRGASATFDVEVTDDEGNPVDLTDAGIVVTVRPYVGHPDVTFEKRNTETGGDETQATVLDPPEDGVLRFFFIPDDSSDLEQNTYHYDVWVILADGTQACVVEPDDLVVDLGVTELP